MPLWAYEREAATCNIQILSPAPVHTLWLLFRVSIKLFFSLVALRERFVMEDKISVSDKLTSHVNIYSGGAQYNTKELYYPSCCRIL
jgi:hypothetical protein